MTSTIIHKTFEAKLSEDDNYVEGYVSTWGNVDQAGDTFDKGAYTKTLDGRNGRGVVLLAQHDPRQPIGKSVNWREDDIGLFMRFKFGSHVAGQDARTQIKDGILGGFSVGFQSIKDEPMQLKSRQGRRFKEVRLVEVSAVTFPCNEAAVFTDVKEAPEDALDAESCQDAAEALMPLQDAPEGSDELSKALEALDLVLKAGARNSGADAKRIQAVHDHAAQVMQLAKHLGAVDPDADGDNDASASTDTDADAAKALEAAVLDKLQALSTRMKLAALADRLRK